VIFTTITCLIIYFFAKKLFGGRFIPAMASIIFTFETAWFVHSRIALLEVFLSTFVVAGFYFLWLYLENNNCKDFILAATFFGLGLAVKWSAAFPIITAVLVLFIFKKTKIGYKAKLAAALISLPIVIYFLSYTPLVIKTNFQRFLSLNQKMWQFHTVWIPYNFEKVAPPYIPKFDYVHNIFNNPSSWILNKPITYLEEVNSMDVKEILFIFNPITFWPGLLLIIFSFVKGIQTRNKKLIYLFLIFASSYIPWFFSPRFSIPYYLLFGITALIINLAYYINLVRKKSPIFAYLYIGLIILTFCLFYPVISFSEVKISYLTKLTSIWGLPVY